MDDRGKAKGFAFIEFEHEVGLVAVGTEKGQVTNTKPPDLCVVSIGIQ